MDHLKRLAEFAATTAPGKDVREKTALILADSIGAIVGGADETEVRALTEHMAGRSSGAALVIGRGAAASPETAAFLNGTAGTTLEMDEGHQFCKGHPGIHVIPAVLAAASDKTLSGRDVLTAIAIGYETAARVGIATSLRPSMHPHGTWGAIGAATAVLRLCKKPVHDHVEAMNIAANLSLTTSRRTMLEGGTVRNAFAGVSNRMGLLAADLVDAGYSGDRDGVGNVFGQVAADSFDFEALTLDLGERWEVMRNYFKMHACCRFNHAALDALHMLCADLPDLRPEDIETIVVDSYALAAELDDPAPKNVLAAKFSVPFAIATTLVTRSSGVESFAADKIGDDDILALAKRVDVREDPSMSAKLPDERPARVAMTLRDGRIFTAATDTNRGDWADPYPAQDLRKKFLALTGRLWPTDKSEAVWNAVLDLDAAPDVSTLLDLLAAGDG